MAELLGIGRDAAYAAVAAGTLPGIRVGRRIIVPTAQLFALLGLTPDMSEAAPARAANATTSPRQEKLDETHATLPRAV